MYSEYLKKVREKRPLIHHITNYVTVNDVANMVLACGASPIMADDPREMEEVTSKCDGLCLNTGTISESHIQSMLIAGKRAGELGHGIVLDPVGVGVSELRRNTVNEILQQVKPDVVRCNISEIKSMIGNVPAQYGVDVDFSQRSTEEGLERDIAAIKAFALKSNMILAVTGETDIVTDGREVYLLGNGRREMRYITGMGCQLSGVTAAFITANPENRLKACVAAMAMVGIAGEIAWQNMLPGDGNATYRNRIIDAVYNMSGDILDAGIRINIR